MYLSILLRNLQINFRKVGIKTLTKHEKGKFCIDAVYKYIDLKVCNQLKTNTIKGIYAYEDGALHSFRQAKSLGIASFYDLPIGYWRTARKLLEEENERWPEWAATLTGFKDSPAKLARKDEELALADRIFVASSFTARTLEDYPAKLAPVEVIPYGFPPVAEERSYERSAKLKMLFVGGLSPAKRDRRCICRCRCIERPCGANGSRA